MQALENTMNHMQDVVTQTNRMNKSILQFLNKAIHNPSFLQQILQVQASRASHGNHGNEYLTHRDSLKYGTPCLFSFHCPSLAFIPIAACSTPSITNIPSEG